MKKPMWYNQQMNGKLKTILEKAERWPAQDQEALVEFAQMIESGKGEYIATSEELAAIDDAERSGVASQQEVDAAFAAFGISFLSN